MVSGPTLRARITLSENDTTAVPWPSRPTGLAAVFFIASSRSAISGSPSRPTRSAKPRMSTKVTTDFEYATPSFGRALRDGQGLDRAL